MAESNRNCRGQKKLKLFASHGNVVHARIGLGRSETCAASQVVLGRLSAAQATALAPAQQACCLAVLEAVVGHCVVALGASRTDGEFTLGAAGELVTIDAGKAQGILATLVLLVADSLGISQVGLIICRASSSGHGLEARIGLGGSETGAASQ